MAAGFLDLAYLIEISIVLNLAYRELNHNSLMKKIDHAREEINNDTELQLQLNAAKAEENIAEKTLIKKYNKFLTIIECTSIKVKDCRDKESKLNKSWEGKKLHCKYFVKNILNEKAKVHTLVATGLTIVILVFATISSHIEYQTNNEILWGILFFVLFCSTAIPIYHFIRSTLVSNYLLGRRYSKDNGRINDLKEDFTDTYNQYVKEQSEKQNYK